MISLFLSNTPIWVWPLLLGLLVLGLRQTRTQQMSWMRMTVLPLVLVGLSVYGTLAIAGAPGAALLLWALVALGAATLVLRQRLPAGAHYDLAHQRFTVPGSAVPLALMMGIFLTKYAVGATQALAPALLQTTLAANGIAALYGLCSGVLLGRSLRLWKLAAQTDAQWHHGGHTPRATA
ncbi:DUF6622 family protein [Rhodoferax sp. TS-BS-61-7]|uniref:DUF6622 family protein n=1 Tax=Rhodoferax sp. TS-BS-61-7 TaxID=2094194 RepID=UPI000CF669D2|nr:DUF6622 family protein [Rhodoferax sp. TS-BS-61-7]PQA76381.1 hypothetical protein C5F53_15765 [Rhodoferax sp. TS-BS-61-7]